jgi:hypothetical protein
MALTYRDEKGSNLTAAEVDANFRELEEAIADFVAPEGRGILSMSVVGDQLYVNLTDATQIGPYTLPTVAYRWRDEWAAGTEYEVYDFFSVAGDGVYLVLQEYTSPEDTTEGPATFDPSVENTEGPLLEKMFGTPSNGPILFAFETGDFTLGADHFGRYVRTNSASPVTVSIDLEANSGIAEGQITSFRQYGAGQINFAGLDTSIIINTPETLTSRKQGSTVTLVYLGGDEYDLAGDLELV